MRKRERNCQMNRSSRNEAGSKECIKSNSCSGVSETHENEKGFRKRNNKNLVGKSIETSDKDLLIKQKEHLEKRLEMINAQLENKVSYLEEVI